MNYTKIYENDVSRPFFLTTPLLTFITNFFEFFVGLPPLLIVKKLKTPKIIMEQGMLLLSQQQFGLESKYVY